MYHGEQISPSAGKPHYHQNSTLHQLLLVDYQMSLQLDLSNPKRATKKKLYTLKKWKQAAERIKMERSS